MITLHHIPYSRFLRTPEYLAKSPGGRAPALEIDATVIFESPAITEYLCETRVENGLGRLAGNSERILFLQWLSYAETQASIIALLNLQMVFLRPSAKASPVVLKLEVARLRGTLKVLEDALGGQGWLLTSGFSAADTMMGFNLFAVPFFVELDPFPNVRAYIDRINARPAYQAALAKEGPQAFYAQDFYPVPVE